MRKFNATEQAANQQRFTRQSVESWVLVYGKQTLHGPADYAACAGVKKFYKTNQMVKYPANMKIVPFKK